MKNNIICTLLSFFMLFASVMPIRANENLDLYAYSSNTEKFDSYAVKNFGSFTYGYYGQIDTTIQLGKGMLIENTNDCSIVLYPAWKNENIIGVYLVTEVNGVYSGTYSESGAKQLNYIKDLNSTTPIRIINLDNNIFISVNDNLYDLDNENIKIEEYETVSLDYESKCIVNLNEFINYEVPSLRSSDSFVQNWLVYYYDPSVDYYCYAYCLSNVLNNINRSTFYKYNFDYCKNNILVNGFITGTAGFTQIKEFLDDENIDYYSVSTGYLSFSQVKQYLYDYDNYIMMGLSSSGLKHFSVLYGYTSTSNNTTYNIWDPQSNGGGRLTISANTRTYTNSDGSVYTWDSGAITYFRK